ncbi:MAG: heme lyase CcmF/NrfE family subunit, partial [Solirubrobacteraceae bacterium]|nr:heme lyase CcmF/NrfE family subunit [Solirubrobacteraceae bacterium]
ALVRSGRRSLYALFALAAIAFLITEFAFFTSDFHFTVVATHSSTTTPWYYRLAAMWSSQQGSLMLWLTLLAGWSSLCVVMLRGRLRDVAPYAVAVLLGFGAFFTAVMLFSASPFTTVPVAPPEGVGLNPLLRHPSMMIHPIMLYSGYTLFTIPFAFAVGALIVRRVDAEWLRATRVYALAAWLALGVGIILGARWSYAELGWGGYWAWDPVENAALLPWLTGTAFLHSVKIQERRGMMKVWNASLVLATGVLAILGTFLVRSGVLDSIHAFVQEGSGVAWFFTALIVVMIAGSVYLVITRRGNALKSESRLDSLLSRESAFLGNNLVLVAIAFVVLWGTFFPLISEALTGQKEAVGPPWFDQYTVPLVLILVLLSGIGPVIAWRRTSWSRLWRSMRAPAILALLVAAGCIIWDPANGDVGAIIMFVVGAFAIGISLQELWRGTRARQAMTGEGPFAAFRLLLARNRARYGGFIVHIGVSVLFIGLAASSSFQSVRDVRLSVGQQTTLDGYNFTYAKPVAKIETQAGRLERITLGSQVRVTKDGKFVANLYPNRGYYPAVGSMLGAVSTYFAGESTSEIGLKAGVTEDLWIAESPDISSLMPVVRRGDAVFEKAASQGLEPEARSIFLAAALNGLTSRYLENPPPAQFRVLVSPMVFWIWIGSIIVIIGAVIAAWPAVGAVRDRVRARQAARVAVDLGRA